MPKYTDENTLQMGNVSVNLVISYLLLSLAWTISGNAILDSGSCGLNLRYWTRWLPWESQVDQFLSRDILNVPFSKFK